MPAYFHSLYVVYADSIRQLRREGIRRVYWGEDAADGDTTCRPSPLIKYIFIVYQFKNEALFTTHNLKMGLGWDASEQPINSIVCAGTHCETLCNNEILSEHFPKIVFPVLSRYLIDFLSMRPESSA